MLYETLLHLHNQVSHVLCQIKQLLHDCTLVLPISPPHVLCISTPGRPKLYINMDLVELLSEANFTWEDISQAIGVSRTTLWRQINIPHVFSNISNDALDSLVSQYQSRE